MGKLRHARSLEVDSDGEECARSWAECIVFCSSCVWVQWPFFCSFLLKNILFILREGGREGERKGEKH